MIDLDSDKLPKFDREPSYLCAACLAKDEMSVATDWDHIRRYQNETNLGGHKHYFNKGDQIIALCRKHHQERHLIGWTAFKNKYGLTDDDLVSLTQSQANERNVYHPKRKNKGMA